MNHKSSLESATWGEGRQSRLSGLCKTLESLRSTYGHLAVPWTPLGHGSGSALAGLSPERRALPDVDVAALLVCRGSRSGRDASRARVRRSRRWAARFKTAPKTWTNSNGGLSRPDAGAIRPRALVSAPDRGCQSRAGTPAPTSSLGLRTRVGEDAILSYVPHPI